MQNYEPELYNLPIDTMAHYIRVMIEAARTEEPSAGISNYRLTEVPGISHVETWEIV
jgi:hypothetical protein